MDNEENEVIDLTEILSAVRQHLLKLIFVTLAAALVGFTASKFLMTPKYDSSALIDCQYPAGCQRQCYQ